MAVSAVPHPRSMARPLQPAQCERILEAALAVAEEEGWTSVRPGEVARSLGLEPREVLDCYRDLDSMADAWFLRGWQAMLAERGPGFLERPPRERVEIVMLAWFDAFAHRRRVTVEMIRAKLHPSHLHHWVPMVFNLSRTIHWLREAASLPARYGSLRAQAEEVGLTALFLATFFVWAGDDSPGQLRTRHFLSDRLDGADRLLTRLWGG